MSREMVADATCHHPNCASKETYRLKATCLNCGIRFIVLRTKGHERPLMPTCPVCEVTQTVAWGGLA